MRTVQENIVNVERLLEDVKAHCMCLKFIDDGVSYMVVYPEGDFGVDGTRVHYVGTGKTWALTKLLEKIETHWMESYP
jgi:hypothetical protein